MTDGLRRAAGALAPRHLAAFARTPPLVRLLRASRGPPNEAARDDRCRAVAHPSSRGSSIGILDRAGFRTVPATDGDEVVDLALAHAPAVIVLDLMMARLDGYTTLTRLQGHAVTQGIPVIILTGQVDPRFQALSAGLGAVAHVTKPFSRRQLVETVRRVVADLRG